MLNKRQLLVALALSLVAAAGCDRIKGLLGKGGVNQDSVKAAVAAQARKDSLARAQAVRDSLARVRWTACSDSVEKALKKTRAGRKELAGKSKMPAGMLLPSVLKACGGAPPPPPAPKPTTPATTGAAGTAAKPTPAGAKSAPAAAAPAPAGKPGAPSATAAKPGSSPAPAPANGKPAAAPTAKPAGPALTPAQLRVARADSIRKVREAAQADSVAKAREKARVDSLAKVHADSVRQDSLRLARETEVLRENFAYGGGSRDPFQSLIQRNSSSVEFGDLVLIGIYQDLRSARNSVALLRDKNTGKRYKVHIGEKIGARMTVAQITERDVTFTIQDFGFERQETLSLPKKGEEANQ